MQYFLSADITGAYFCYPLQEGPQGGDLTCFLTHRGKYVFTVLPQGCSVSQDFLGTTLSEVLDHEDLKDDHNKGVIRIIDDIAGYSKDLPTFKRMTRALFTQCKEYNVKLQPSKFQFSTEQINFAGVVISKEGVQPDPERMSGLARYPRPTTCKQVKSFLGAQPPWPRSPASSCRTPSTCEHSPRRGPPSSGERRRKERCNES